MQRRLKKTHFVHHKQILFCLIVILLGIFSYRLTHYFKQVEIKTNSAVLLTKPDIDATEITALPKGMRLTILKSKYHWYYVKTQTKKWGWVADWMLSKRDVKMIDNLSQATIVIDAGHGGDDSGALSNDGKLEKHYTLRFALALAEKLKKLGTKVYLTRSNDEYVGLKTRPALAQKVHADAFISFHFDSVPVANSASGFTTYYYHKNTSYALAKTLNSAFTKLTLENRGIEFGDFLVIRENTTPAVLLEMGYINSNYDFAKITNRNYQNQVINAITDGLKEYFIQQKNKS